MQLRTTGQTKLIALAVALAVSGCTDILEAPGVSASTGGGAGVGGAGGAGGAMDSTGSLVSKGGPPLCGWPSFATCSAEEWCQHGDGYDSSGTCQPRPASCPEDCPGSCGTDGNFYCNDCLAHQAGFDVRGNLLCTDTFHALRIQDSVPSFALYVGSPSRGLCFRIVVASGQFPGFAIDGDGWSVRAGEVTNYPDDCNVQEGDLWSPVGQSFSAQGGKGHIWVDAASAECVFRMNAYLTFPGAPMWASEIEVFETGEVVVEGGCM